MVRSALCLFGFLLAWIFFYREVSSMTFFLAERQELQASAVDMGTSRKPCLVLLHKRRVPTAAIRGESAVRICRDCHRSFSGKKPSLCKYALANDLWLGRIDPLLWEANLTHEMCFSGKNGSYESGFAFWTKHKPRSSKSAAVGSRFSSIRLGGFCHRVSQRRCNPCGGKFTTAEVQWCVDSYFLHWDRDRWSGKGSRGCSTD